MTSSNSLPFYSYNAAGTINVNLVQNNTEMGDALEAMKAEIKRAEASGLISLDTAAQAGLSLTQAAREARMPAPSKPTLIDHLEDAQTALSGIDPLSALVDDLGKAAAVVQTVL